MGLGQRARQRGWAAPIRSRTGNRSRASSWSLLCCVPLAVGLGACSATGPSEAATATARSTLVLVLTTQGQSSSGSSISSPTSVPVRVRVTDLASQDLATAQQVKGVAGCLSAKGYPVRVLTPSEGGWGISPPTGMAADQSAGYGQALTACLAQFPTPAPEMSRTFAEEIWARQLAVVQCLRDNDFTLQGQPPAKDVFVGQLLSKGAADWTAFDLLPDQSDVRIAASSKCPQSG